MAAWASAQVGWGFVLRFCVLQNSSVTDMYRYDILRDACVTLRTALAGLLSRPPVAMHLH